MNSTLSTLLDKIDNRTARIGIIGLGYVGLPLAVEFAKAGFNVTGFDTDTRKIQLLNNFTSYIPDVPTSDVVEMVTAQRLRATQHFALLGDMDAAIICVPTPLKKTKDPDIQYIVAACESIAKYIHAPMFISLESSTYPGTTDELMVPMFTTQGFKVGKDLFVCFSPERVDPGNRQWQTKNIPKVIGGITPECTLVGERLYSAVLEKVITVQGTRTAEMVKLLENTFRMVNIGLVNELALECDRMDINIWEVIDAAATKPFGFMPFYPGPGLGGHCIPIDPFYFSWKAKQYGLESRFIETAGHVNGQMSRHVVQKVQDALNKDKKAINGSNILLLGVAYKKDIDDVRESPALDVATLLIEKGATITYHDPHIPEVTINGTEYKSIPAPTGKTFKYKHEIDDPFLFALYQADCVVILTDHSHMDYKMLLEWGVLVVDTRNALKGLTDPRIVRL